MYLFVFVCEHIGIEVRGQHQVSSSLHLIFWDRDSHWSKASGICLFWGYECSWLPLASYVFWGYGCSWLPLASYMGSKDLNSESHAFLCKHFTDWAISPGILLIIFLKQGFKNQVPETKKENHKTLIINSHILFVIWKESLWNILITSFWEINVSKLCIWQPKL